MSRMRCLCGDTLADTTIPNDVRIWAYTDDEWREVVNYLVNDKWYTKLTLSIWYCPKCKRLYVTNNEANIKKVYAIEEKYSSRTKEFNDVLSKCPKDSLAKVWAFEDEEKGQVTASITKGNVDVVPKNEVWYCSDCQKVFVHCSEKKEIRIYNVEQVVKHES